MTRVLSPIAETINSLIQTFGSLTLEQINKIAGNEDSARRNASHLILRKCIKEKDGIYVPLSRPNPDPVMVDCLWVALNRAKKEDGSVDLIALENAFASKPIKVAMVANNMFYNIVYISKENITSDLPFVVARFDKANKKGGKTKGMEYIFAVKDQDVIHDILAQNLDMPYRIVLLDYSEDKKEPKLKYLKQD